MRHDRLPKVRGRSLLIRKRFQFAGALAVGGLLPWALRAPRSGATLAEPSKPSAEL